MKFSKMILILILVIPFYGCATEWEEIVKRPSKPRAKHIYFENEQIYGYFDSYARISEVDPEHLQHARKTSL